jgi:hypothetical protein
MYNAVRQLAMRDGDTVALGCVAGKNSLTECRKTEKSALAALVICRRRIQRSTDELWTHPRAKTVIPCLSVQAKLATRSAPR